MYGETGEPKDGNTKIAGQGRCRTENVECGKELDMQNETDKQILSTLNQDNFQNSSGGEKAAEDDEMGLFSQGFMDRMREMVSEQFGEEAAERFMVQNKDMIKEEKTTSAVPESEKRLPQTKTADAPIEQSVPLTAEHPDISEETAAKGPSKRSHRRWVWRAAAVLVVVLAGFGVHRAGSVSATKMPAVNTAPETTASIDYSKIGSRRILYQPWIIPVFRRRSSRFMCLGRLRKVIRKLRRKKSQSSSISFMKMTGMAGINTVR